MTLSKELFLAAVAVCALVAFVSPSRAQQVDAPADALKIQQDPDMAKSTAPSLQ